LSILRVKQAIGGEGSNKPLLLCKQEQFVNLAVQEWFAAGKIYYFYALTS
jgi:hypothetical protein